MPAQAPAVHPSPSAEKCYSHNGLPLVSTQSPFYHIAPELDELSRPPANSELMCCLQEPERGAVISAVIQPDAF